MKPAPFRYHDPSTVAEAVSLLAALENAKVLAGGQSLGPMLNLRLVMPDHVVDVNRIDALAGIRVNPDRVTIGAMTRQRAIERTDALHAVMPILREALAEVGHFQTRNRGTIGGSLCHLDPAAELAGIAALYGAEFAATGPAGGRRIAADAWVAGYMTPALEPGELLTGIEFPLWREPHGHAFLEFARRRGDFAIAGVGALVALDGNGAIARAALSVIGVGYVPLRLVIAEAALHGARPDADAFAAAAAALDPVEAIEDVHASGGYRKRIAKVLVARALTLAVERANRAKGAARG